MIQLIATDLDETLLDDASRITPRTLRALKAVMAAGAGISLSSGRMAEAMLPFAEEIGVNAPMILFNGALVYDHRTGETLYANALPEKTAKQVAELLEEMDVYFQIYPASGYYCREITETTRSYVSRIRVPCQPVHEPLSRWMKGDMQKLLAISEVEKIDKARERLQQAFPKGVSFMKSHPTFLEIVAEGIDKGSALRELAGKLGIPMENVMAFGDGQNDESMIAAAGWGVAMENATEGCRAAARIVAPRYDEDGVAQVLEKGLAEGWFQRG
ncbi:MAG: HAD family phosphatase [Clostridia bacterium]|nr:HAD family phosphatase [Clostridia bacterium]